ncbi:MAG: stage II sporulation protein P [Bacilli bacterium]|nr:stage II sporulation protein P [Bacilli bacterium]MDD3304860.1 stage II sporulation protein P [Bacilli bacterium]MDD4053705.1 stage II sporulation protein P [Bacilli bacterium]MDD4411576.1 stage II sporulation protein P [Bacilli bacterium]
MGRTFIAKKHKRRIFKFRYLIFFFIIYLSFDTTYAYLLNRKTSLESDIYIKMILSNTNHNFKTDYKPSEIVNETVSLLTNININEPTSLLTFNVKEEAIKAVADLDTNYVDHYDFNKQEKITEYIKDPNPTIVNKPRVYIYNSHQLENYNAKNLEIYNITPNVMMASYMLKENLNDLGIGTLVNESNLTEFIRINNWSHADSYKASRIFILDAKGKYDSLEYYIDIHRDAIKKDAGTREINGRKYARTLFVVGLENPNYEANLALANELHKRINKAYPGLSRGVIKKEGKGVDGIYNQDISPKSMLVEVGGYENTIEEAMATVEALAKILYDYIEASS